MAGGQGRGMTHSRSVQNFGDEARGKVKTVPRRCKILLDCAGPGGTSPTAGTMSSGIVRAAAAPV